MAKINLMYIVKGLANNISVNEIDKMMEKYIELNNFSDCGLGVSDQYYATAIEYLNKKNMLAWCVKFNRFDVFKLFLHKGLRPDAKMIYAMIHNKNLSTYFNYYKLYINN